MAEGAKKYSDLKDTLEWKPSDKSPEEHILAMLAQSKGGRGSGRGRRRQANSRGGNEGRGGRGERGTTTTNPARQLPPFSKNKVKEGDTKEWEGNPGTTVPSTTRTHTGFFMTQRSVGSRNAELPLQQV
jgi:hypothetical protein